MEKKSDGRSCDGLDPERGGYMGQGTPNVVSTMMEHAKNKDADTAMTAYDGREGEVIPIDEATSRRLLRKIGLNILPVSNQFPVRENAGSSLQLMCLIYCLNYLDTMDLSSIFSKLTPLF
jgi:hypothetical protein